MRDLKEFRKIQGDDTLGGMVICETSEQARRLYDVFKKNGKNFSPSLSKSNFLMVHVYLVSQWSNINLNIGR